MSEIKEFARKTKTGRDVLRPRLENGLSMRFVGAFFVCLFDFYSPYGRFMPILIFIAVVDNEWPLFT